MLPLICVWTNAWVNNRDAGDLRRYRVHYDVTVMISNKMFCHMISGSPNTTGLVIQTTLSHHYVWTCMSEASNKDKDTLLHPIDSVGCYYLSLVLIPASHIFRIQYHTALLYDTARSATPTNMGRAFRSKEIHYCASLMLHIVSIWGKHWQFSILMRMLMVCGIFCGDS